MRISQKFVSFTTALFAAWNDIGLSETQMTIAPGQDLLFVQRLRFEPAFDRLTLNGRLVGISLTNSITVAYTSNGGTG